MKTKWLQPFCFHNLNSMLFFFHNLNSMPGKLSVPGRPTSLDDSRQRPIAPAIGAGGVCLDIFSLICLASFSFSLSLGDGPI